MKNYHLIDPDATLHFVHLVIHHNLSQSSLTSLVRSLGKFEEGYRIRFRFKDIYGCIVKPEPGLKTLQILGLDLKTVILEILQREPG